MKTTTQVAVKVSARTIAFAKAEPGEMKYIRDNEISDEAIAMLYDYQDALSLVVRFKKENDDLCGTDLPSFDLALRHALKIALVATRAQAKQDHGQWALRKLKKSHRTGLKS